MKHINVMHIDPSTACRRKFYSMFSHRPEFCISSHSGAGTQVLIDFSRMRPDLVVVEDADAMPLAINIRARSADVRIVFLSSRERPNPDLLRQVSANGYLFKSDPSGSLVARICAVMVDPTFVALSDSVGDDVRSALHVPAYTDAEAHVLSLYASGSPFPNPPGIERSLCRKMGVKSLDQLRFKKTG